MLFTILKYKFTQFTIVAILGMLSGFGVSHFYFPPIPATIIKTERGPVVTVTEWKDRVVIKELVKYVPVKDAAEAERLLAQNKQLGDVVDGLSVSNAMLQSEKNSIALALTTANAKVTELTGKVTRFKDWRLDFSTNGAQAEYTLSQKFSLMTVTGRDKNGVRFTDTRLFELDAKENRVPVPVTQAVQVYEDRTKPHWQVGFSVQAGVGVSIPTRSPVTKQTGAIVGAQIFTRGRTAIAEDKTLAVATPVMFLNDTIQEVGILPISFNLGMVPRQPFRDLWLSPYVGFSGLTSGKPRVGVVITATF